MPTPYDVTTWLRLQGQPLSGPAPHEGFGGAFNFRAIFRRAGLYPGMTVTVWLIASVLGVIIACLGLIVVGIGFLFTLTYAFALSANLYGQFRQRTESGVTAPDGSAPGGAAAG